MALSIKKSLITLEYWLCGSYFGMEIKHNWQNMNSPRENSVKELERQIEHSKTI